MAGKGLSVRIWKVKCQGISQGGERVGDATVVPCLEASLS